MRIGIDIQSADAGKPALDPSGQEQFAGTVEPVFPRSPGTLHAPHEEMAFRGSLDDERVEVGAECGGGFDLDRHMQPDQISRCMNTTSR